MEDFPAAHSMDTTWFAVDASGNIGVFDSGEGGAIPASNRIFRTNAIQKELDCSRIDNIHDLFWEWSKKNDEWVLFFKPNQEANCTPCPPSLDNVNNDVRVLSFPSEIEQIPSNLTLLNYYFSRVTE